MSRETFHFIPHSHWEGAVFETREEYLEKGWQIILRALRLLRMHPSYRFVLDQACLVKPFLERHPEEAGTFRRFLREGRLAIVGGTHVMPDVNMPCGESFVRQVLYGKRYFRAALGADPTVGWLLDTFGHHAQMPQLMRLAGYASLWAQRGVPDPAVPSEQIWEGLDGTRIPFYWMPCSYAVAYGSPATLPEFTAFMKERWDRLAPHSLGAGRAGPAGADVCMPEDHVPALVEEFNRGSDAPFRIRISLPADYEAEVEKRTAERPVIRGERNPIFQGTYSSRIELKQATRELERLLGAAEKLDAVLAAAGEPPVRGALWQAWEPMLFNQAHDLMSGVMTDHVHEDTLRSYDFSLRLAREAVESRMRRLAATIDTRGEGVPIVVFNPVSWTRTDVAFAEAGLTGPDARGLRLLGPDGRTVPVQVLDPSRTDTGTPVYVKLAFLARDVPGLGHAVYHLAPSASGRLPAPAVPVPGNALENEHCRVEVDLGTGAITRLRSKDGGWDALRAPGNVVARERDQGDLWELYRLLNAGQAVPPAERHRAPQRHEAVWSDERPGIPGLVTRGPVYSEFGVSHPFGDKGRFATTVGLYAGVRRVEIRTRILNGYQAVRYRLLFPTSIREGRSVHEIPFGALDRPEGVEFPAQGWVDYGDGDRGVALLNRGLPGNNVSDGVLLLSLLRAVRIEAYGGWELHTDSGFELGKEICFDYAVVPHRGDWRKARIYRDGHEFNNPLLACTAGAHPGPLLRRGGFLQVSHPGVVVSALKPGEDGGVVVRLYETSGAPAKGVALAFDAPPAGAQEVDLLERNGRAVGVERNRVVLDFRPFEIKTLKLKLAGRRRGQAGSR